DRKCRCGNGAPRARGGNSTGPVPRPFCRRNPYVTHAPRRTEKTASVAQAADLVRDGMTIALGGFINSGHPMPVVRELIRRRRKDLTVVGPASGGLDLDLLVAGGCVRKLVSCYFGAETLAPISPMIKRAAERGEIEIFECDE